MKKVLILISILSLSYGQALNRSEEELVPAERFDIMPTKIIENNLSSPVILLNQNQSKFAWKGGLKFGTTNHDGNLKMQNGNITLDNNKISGEVVINMLSLTNSDLPAGSGERLVGHLRSADFFNVERFPTAKLKIQKSRIIEKLGDGHYKMIIDGDMTIKGVTNPISFEVKVNLDADIKTAEGKFIFNRNDFNIQYRSEMHLEDPKTFWNKLQTTRDTAKDKVIRDEIEISFNIISMPGMLSK